MNIKPALLIFLVLFVVGCAVENESAIDTNESAIDTQTNVSSGSKLGIHPKLEEVYAFTMPAAEIECFERIDQPLYIFCQSPTNPGNSNGLWIQQGDEILGVDIVAKGHAATMEMGLYKQADSVDVLSIYESFRTE